MQAGYIFAREAPLVGGDDSVSISSGPPVTNHPNDPVKLDDSRLLQKEMFGHIRSISRQAKLMQKLLQTIIKKKTDVTDPGARAREVITTWHEGKKEFLAGFDEIDYYFKQIRLCLQERKYIADLYNQISDDFVSINEAWENMYELRDRIIAIVDKSKVVLAGEPTIPTNPKPQTRQQVLTPEQADSVISLCNRLNDAIEDLVYYTTKLTIPERVNQHLAQRRVGQALDFYAVFEDELPTDKNRQKDLLKRIEHASVIDGVVNVENGVIYRASSDEWRRNRSLWVMIAIIVGGAIGLGLVTMYADIAPRLPLPARDALAPLAGWSFKDPMLVPAYLLVMLGGIAHLFIDAIKQFRREGDRSTFLALENVLLWIHVKEAPLTLSIIFLWIAFFVLTITQSKIDLLTAFVVGYSIDSLVDLGLNRFNQFLSLRKDPVGGMLRG